MLLSWPCVTSIVLRTILETSRSPPLVPSQSDVKVVDVKSSAVATFALRQQWLLKVILETEGFNDWGGRGYDEFVPGEVTKIAPSRDETTWSPT